MLLGDATKGLMTGRLTRGCELCYAGLKAVIFITGVCDENCFYCPVDRDRFGRRVMYVNDERAYDINDIIREVERQGATGASITGGDPLADLPLTLSLIRALKATFGPEFHIHLYTPGRHSTPEALLALWRAGLDEIRFHPVSKNYMKGIEYAVRLTGMRVGAEMPIAPGLEGWVKEVIKFVDSVGGHFVNLDEMEFAEPNREPLRLRGLRPDDSREAAVKGSLRAAMEVLSWAESNVRVPVHFCPVSFKDLVQVRNRYRRTASRDLRWYEVPLDDGTVARGEIVGEDGDVIGYFRPGEQVSLPKGAVARVVVTYPTQARSPVLCEAESEDPAEAFRECS
ncbi:hypothetical protein ASAC_0585 [Acidilobus saccharovorans 345-15]|uniref:Radical SAM core domain-containing protein n=1 Tax=Acidilobus saccharovorans (strain DSM 16705 / JCM 18335 / VKM B-2471 / 345-15) TaxID=666510 RepID=D9Q104_ACIS3|nr:radical SAM protein [Acidilobus saccharovorans]ADL18992.1 hypothetical protein ASAC_0585 [Acidilobus saccharovorans 345-15]